uniref:Lipocalin n=1 Tax=Rhipicephalus appendiculatus TaxID=34631 RepID=A0A131Z1L6_RHIAP
MQTFPSMKFSLIVVYAVLFAWTTNALRGPSKLQRETPDTFKVFDGFEHAIAITDIDNDSILDCLSAYRTAYDPEAHTATYVWSLASPDGNKSRQHASLHFKAGDTPDTVKFTVGSDDTVEVARFRFTDYKTCAVVELPHFGDQCTLWVNDGVQDHIPEKCLDQFADICGNGVSHYDAEMCMDVE